MNFKVKCVRETVISIKVITIGNEYDASFHPERTDFYLIKNDTGSSSYQPSFLFEPIDISEVERAKELHQKDLEYWRSIKKVICITIEHNGSIHGGINVGEIYDVLGYIANSKYFRINGKLTDTIYPRQLFITLQQHRQTQLEKLLK